MMAEPIYNPSDPELLLSRSLDGDLSEDEGRRLDEVLSASTSLRDSAKALAAVNDLLRRWAVETPLVDADEEIVRRTGQSIQSIFDDQGEPAFRELERTVLADLCAGSQQIISAGGGAFLDSDNRQSTLQNGLVFCLSATPKTILDRVKQDQGEDAPLRPLLSGDNPRQSIVELLARRAEFYTQAHHTIDTDALTPEQVAERILGLCELD